MIKFDPAKGGSLRISTRCLQGFEGPAALQFLAPRMDGLDDELVHRMEVAALDFFLHELFGFRFDFNVMVAASFPPQLNHLQE